jgi:hypothetical protein
MSTELINALEDIVKLREEQVATLIDRTLDPTISQDARNVLVNYAARLTLDAALMAAASEQLSQVQACADAWGEDAPYETSRLRSILDGKW